MVQANAFVGAEGYGASTVGGRGSAVVHVTNLQDKGEGSLRWALETLSGPRTIVFDVNGTITLATQITVKNSYVTIAGQTAQGEGITIEGSRLRIDASEVIVRGLQFRPGDGAVGMDVNDRDGLFIGSNDDVQSNIVIDHNSFSWSIDENAAATGLVENITFSNNIIAQGLSQSLHKDGEHSKGAGTGNWNVPDPVANNHISFIKNLFADNTARNAEIGSGDAIEFINNYVFNYGMSHIGASLGGSATAVVRANLIGNVYDPGLDTPAGGKGPFFLGAMTDGSALYFADNVLTRFPVDPAADQLQSSLYWTGTGTDRYVVGNTAFGSDTAILDSSEVAAYVIANAGAGGSGFRYAVDQRIVGGVIDRTGRIVDSVAEAGGKAPAVIAGPAADTDRDGMPDWFENLFGFDPRLADDNGDADADGYTNLEEYLNGLYTGFDLPAARGFRGLSATPDQSDLILLDPASAAITLIAGFSLADGDRLDLSRYFDPSLTLTAPPGDLVAVNAAGGSTVVSIDRDGAGSQYDWEVAAILENLRVDGRQAIVSPQTFSGGPDASADVVTVTGNGPTAPVDVATGGGGDQVYLAGTGITGRIDGGPGGDVLTVTSAGAADLTALSLSSLELLETRGFRVVATPEQFAGFEKIVNNEYQLWLPASIALSAPGTLDLSAQPLSRPLVIGGSTGADRILAGSGDDTVDGGDGADELFGMDGIDALTGGAGDDRIYGGGGARDTIEGGDGNDVLFGGDGRDSMFGGAGDDILYGDTDLDQLRGGAGADIYYVDDDDDAVNERFGQTAADGTSTDDGSIDLVISTADRLLTQFVENLVLVGTAALKGIGNLLDNLMYGNAGDNLLQGMAGDDILHGGGGNDMIEGGDGDDMLIADGMAAGQAATLRGGAGIDRFVVAAAPGSSVVIADFDTDEQLAVGGTFAMGEAADRSAVITLAGGQTVQVAGISPSVLFYDPLEGVFRLGTTGIGGLVLQGTDGNDNLVGKSTNDRLYGGEGSDKLNGGGGADLMAGGAGADKYTVDDPGDRVVEAFDEGVDIVTASIDFTLPDHVENLQLVGTARSGTGNALANAIRGNELDNVLAGMGGADTLVGGGGSDTFVFLAPDAGVTRIADFQSGVDRIAIDGAAFGLAPGSIGADWFVLSTGAVARDGSHALATTSAHGQFIQDRYRNLYWDADGSGPDKAVLFAGLGSVLLDHGDFVVI